MTRRDTLCLVEDNAENRAILSNALKPHYRVIVASDGEQALDIIPKQKPSLILLDIILPGIDGYEVCKQLKANPDTADIPVIFLTGATNLDAETYGLECGAVDFIHKPYSLALLQARIKNHLSLAACLLDQQQQKALLEQKLQEVAQDCDKNRDAIVLAIASMVEARDNISAQHIERLQKYVAILAHELQADANFTAQLSEQAICLMINAAPLHDIGKINIPDAILLKPGPLNSKEFDVVKQHTTLGRAAIASAAEHLGGYNAFLHCAEDIIYAHQEKWDGSGYPEGIAGDAIPLSARIIALADVYDVLRCCRAYKLPYTHQQAVDIITESSGSHFDPRLVSAFLKCAARFEQIAMDISKHVTDPILE